MGAGKSTKSRLVASENNAVLISEDDWLAQLFPGQIDTFEHYRQYSARLKPLVFDHVVNILQTGTDVVLDFPANTVQQRQWFRELADAAGVAGKLLYLKTSDAVCLEQIAKRRIEQPQRARFDNEAVFKEVSRYFQEPTDAEGLTMEIV
jgi:predicted kinase